MKSASKFAIVLVTAPNLRVARKLAHAALEARLIACANLVPGLESHYWWQGKMDSGREVLMILKTPWARVAALEKLVLTKHPYDTPEFLAAKIERGNRRYLSWIEASVRR